MQMEKGLDTGPVFLEQKVAINNDSTVADLEHQLAVCGAQLLIEVLNSLPAQTQTQSEAGITYAAKLTPADRRVNWHNSAAEIERQIRALADRMPVTATLSEVEVQLLKAQVITADSAAAPGTIVVARKGQFVVQCGTDQLQVQRLRINRGKGLPMDAAAAINGFQRFLPEGAQFDADGVSP
jgi:methionyl-tRNA formyltransferase